MLLRLLLWTVVAILVVVACIARAKLLLLLKIIIIIWRRSLRLRLLRIGFSDVAAWFRARSAGKGCCEIALLFFFFAFIIVWLLLLLRLLLLITVIICQELSLVGQTDLEVSGWVIYFKDLSWTLAEFVNLATKSLTLDGVGYFVKVSCAFVSQKVKDFYFFKKKLSL